MSEASEQTSSPGASRRRWIAAIVFVSGAAAAVMTLRSISPGLPEIGLEDLASAERRWSAGGPASYDLTVVLGGRQTGELTITVRNQVATGLTRNGRAVAEARAWEPWTVPGMFETLATDFENREGAQEKFGVEPQSIHMRCEFDEQLGYPKRYLHQTYGRHQDLEWTVTEFAAR